MRTDITLTLSESLFIYGIRLMEREGRKLIRKIEQKHTSLFWQHFSLFSFGLDWKAKIDPLPN